jgi:hypothetical protein
MAAAATAYELVPEASVFPPLRAPQTPTVSSCGPSTRTSCTFVRSRKAGMGLEDRAQPSSSLRSGSLRTTACGCSTATGVTSIVSAPKASSSAPDDDRPHDRLRGEAVEHPGDHLPVTDPHTHVPLAGACCEPAGGDSRSVPGELGRRAVGVPDDDIGRRALDGHDLEDPVRPDATVVVAEPPHRGRVEGTLEVRPLEEQVVVPEPVPVRESHRRSPPAADRRQG